MVMELGTARWSSTRPQPFGPAPGGGLASTRWSSTSAHPFGPAPGAGRGLGTLTSGFAAERVADPSISMEPERIISKGPFTVKQKPVGVGEIPSLVIRMRYTDRGSLTKSQLDANVKALIKKAGYKVSKASSFRPVDVTWRWDTIGKEASGDVPIYVPVVSTPAALTDVRYAGGAYPESLYEPSSQILAKIPGQVFIYTLAVTSGRNTMADGEAAQVLTLLKQAMVNMASTNSFANVLITLQGCPASVFGPSAKKKLPPVAKAGWSALVLLVAYNMVMPHVGSEVI